MRARAYPRWGGIESTAAAMGRKVPLKYRKCHICGLDATRIGTVQYGWSRSDDEYFGLCPSNDCRDQLKTRECVISKFVSSRSAEDFDRFDPALGAPSPASSDGVRCDACHGSGEVVKGAPSGDPQDEYAIACPECGGSGRV